MNGFHFWDRIMRQPKLRSAQANWQQALPSGWSLALIVGLHGCITLFLAAVLNIWLDEAYTLNTTGSGVAYAFRQAIHFEEQAPLYFVLLALWRRLDPDSILWARSFSILCTSLLIWVGTATACRLYSKLNHKWIALTLAINPFMIWAAVEIRVYAFSTLLSALVLLIFIQVYLTQSNLAPSRLLWLRAAYILTLTIALYTHYFVGCLALGGLVALWQQKKYKTLRQYAIDLAFVGLLFVPMALVIVQQLLYLSDNVHAYPDQSVINLILEGGRKAFSSLTYYILPAQMSQYAPSFWRLLRLLMLGATIGVLIRYRQQIDGRIQSLGVISLTISALFFFIFIAIDLHFRHTNVIFIPTLLLFVGILYFSQQVIHRKILPIGFASLYLLYTVSLCFSYAPLAKPGDYIRVAHYLQQHEQAQQPILVFNAEVSQALSTYYQGENQLVPLPFALRFKKFAWTELVVKSSSQIESALAKVQASAIEKTPIWLVTDNYFLRPTPIYQQSYQVLEAFVEQRFEVIKTQEFYGSTVRLLRPKSP